MKRLVALLFIRAGELCFRLAELACPPTRCRQCGCEDLHACVDMMGDACHWVEPDLCSVCAFEGPPPDEPEPRLPLWSLRRLDRRSA